MSNSVKNISNKAGLPPGTLVHVGSRKVDKIKMSVLSYDHKSIKETICKKPEEIIHSISKDTVNWINIIGLHDVNAIASICNYFGIHSLLIEDILNVNHRPKEEEIDGVIFFTFKKMSLETDKLSIISEQITFILKDNIIISFSEQNSNIYDAFLQRIRDGIGVIRHKKADYLLYRLIDIVVDDYFIITEYLSLASEELEEKVVRNTVRESLQEIQNLKKQINIIRKDVLPLREAISSLQMNQNGIIENNTLRYFRDVYEHVIQLNDTIQSQREILVNIMDLYLSGMSNNTNRVMQILTIISTIFIPLTFIVGVYGMNFENIPELKLVNGYYYIWGIMAALVLVLIYIFRKMKWF